MAFTIRTRARVAPAALDAAFSPGQRTFKQPRRTSFVQRTSRLGASVLAIAGALLYGALVADTSAARRAAAQEVAAAVRQADSVNDGDGSLADLRSYIERADAEAAWRLLDKQTTDRGTVYHLRLTSQRWHGTLWEHDLQVFEPAEVVHDRYIGLYVASGATINRQEMMVGYVLSRKVKARVAILYGVPCQPALGGLTEDELLAETYARYVQTADPSWPLPVPMAKATLRALDAVSELAVDQEWARVPEGFLVAGGSKRAWSTWLAAAVDPRIKAIAPIVLDSLNIAPQLESQRALWGQESHFFLPCAARGLTSTGMFDSPSGQRLWELVDPWSYRRVLELPKLLILATNDPFWPTGAANLYFSDLVGPKHLLYCTNDVHELPQSRNLAAAAISALYLHATHDRSLPELRWTHDEEADGRLRLAIESDTEPTATRLWTAHSPTRDFRGARWRSLPLVAEGPRWIGRVERPGEGHVALLGELEFTVLDQSYSLSTQMRIE